MLSNPPPCCNCHLFGVAEAGVVEGTDCDGCNVLGALSVFAFLLLASIEGVVAVATGRRFDAFATTDGWLR